MVNITTEGTATTVETPYHPDFPAKARQLGGKWDGSRKVWTFDSRDEERVRAVCREVYGTDGTPEEVVTLRYKLGRGDGNDKTLFICGREVAVRFHRDMGVRLGAGVVVVEGRFPSSGGSRNYPAVDGEGVTVEIRDVPKSAVEALVTDYPDQAQIIADPAPNRRTALEAEAVALRARLAEVEAELENLKV